MHENLLQVNVPKSMLLFFSYISWSNKSYCFAVEVIAPHISLDHHSSTATKQDS